MVGFPGLQQASSTLKCQSTRVHASIDTRLSLILGVLLPLLKCAARLIAALTRGRQKSWMILKVIFKSRLL